ncbi:MAG: ABC transporter permease [Deltaproteobacteria bacterium]|nr:ABC transporter permease [Deltaproteobacteria bacterium]
MKNNNNERWKLLRESFSILMRNRLTRAGAIVIALYLITALVAPYFAPYNPIMQDLPNTLKPPNMKNLFGTDEFGRDILTRIIFGARISLLIGAGAVAIAFVLGTILGTSAAYYGGRVDSIVMRIMDIMLSFPAILLAIVIVTILGPRLINVLIAVGIQSTPMFARMIRGSVLSVKENEYVLAARALGANDLRMIINHILPNSMAPMIVLATLRIGTAIITASGLSFLGLGAQPPTPEWGAMLATGRNYLRAAPWVATIPGLAIMTVVFGFNLLGDGLRDAMDPRMKM